MDARDDEFAAAVAVVGGREALEIAVAGGWARRTGAKEREKTRMTTAASCTKCETSKAVCTRAALNEDQSWKEGPRVCSDCFCGIEGRRKTKKTNKNERNE